MAKNWHCIDCDKLIWNRFFRCHSCRSKGKLNPNYGKGLFGKHNPNWRGGIAKNPYSYKFKFRIRKLIREQYLDCQMCGTTEDLIVHHINHNRKDDGYWNLITLCRSCNSKEIWVQNYWRVILGYKCFLKFQEVMQNNERLVTN